jgi:antirestriction protein ArdC
LTFAVNIARYDYIIEVKNMAYQGKAKYYKSDEEKRDHRQELIDTIVQKMKEAVQYQKPWFVCDEIPYNRASGEQYHGSNLVALSLQARSDPRWLTFNQIQELAKRDGVEYSVKGQKGTLIQRWIPAYDKNNDEKVERESPEDPGEGKTFARGGFKYYAVFNAEQIANFPPYQKRDKEFENYLPAEMLIESMKEGGLKFEHHGEGKAYYIPSKDEVWLPHKDRFKTEGLYYRTALHEIGHSTGHPSRLDRDQTGSMRSVDQESLHKYAKEELVAELSSYFVGAELGIPYDSSAHENHAAYLKSWIAALEDPEKGKDFFADSVKQAGKAADFQVSRYHAKLIEMEKSHENEQAIIKPISIEEPTKWLEIQVIEKVRELKTQRKEKESVLTR